MADVGDVDAMAAYSLQLLQDENKLKQFKQNALNQALRFNINEIVPMYENLYEQVAAQTAG